jgi:hypothetical protein
MLLEQVIDFAEGALIRGFPLLDGLFRLLFRQDAGVGVSGVGTGGIPME